MITLGLDISHHQGLNPDLRRAAAEGVQFLFVKATEGASFVDNMYRTNLARGRDAGLLVAAYHYVRAGDSIQSQVDNIKKTVARDVPIIPDVEAGSGDIPRVKTLVGLLRMAGYSVPLSYIPRWYWVQMGSPSLVGLPPLWSSRYPDYIVRSLNTQWERTPGVYWNGYGGLDVAVLQFTSSAHVAGYSPLDANAYRGTREQLAQLLHGTMEEDDDMKTPKLVREKGKPTVWVGDMVTRRWVPDEKTLADYQWQIQQAGGDPTVLEWENINVLGAPVEALVQELSNDEVNIISAFRQNPNATPAQVEEIIRRVIAETHPESTEPPTGS